MNAWRFIVQQASEGRFFPPALQPSRPATGDDMDVAEIAENSEVAEIGEGEKGMEGITPPLPTPPPSSSAEVGEKGEEGRDEAAFAAMLEGPGDGPTSTSSATSTTATSTSTSTTAAGGEGASPMIVSTPTEEKEEGEKEEGKVSVRGLLRVLLSQCQRSHRDYRRSALLCLSTLALAFPDLQDMLALSEATLRGFARIGEGGEEEEGVDQVARARAVEALGAVFPLIPATNHEVRSEI